VGTRQLVVVQVALVEVLYLRVRLAHLPGAKPLPLTVPRAVLGVRFIRPSAAGWMLRSHSV
jgi:hypothetical protein